MHSVRFIVIQIAERAARSIGMIAVAMYCTLTHLPIDSESVLLRDWRWCYKGNQLLAYPRLSIRSGCLCPFFNPLHNLIWDITNKFLCHDCSISARGYDSRLSHSIDAQRL